MVEKPPLHTYDIYLEVEAHGGYGGIWRPFYLSYQNIYLLRPYYTPIFRSFRDSNVCLAYFVIVKIRDEPLTSDWGKI